MKVTMKLTVLLFVLGFSYVSAEEEDVVIEDDEADVEIEDEMEVEGTEGEPEVEPEAPPQMMEKPMEDVSVFIFFPDGAHSLTGGKFSDVVFGVQNNGDRDIEIVSAGGRMMMPGQPEPVQNFTQIGYDKQLVPSKSEASMGYGVFPHLQAGGREFDVTIELYYKEANTNQYYRVVPFKETVNVLESTDGVATEMAFLWLTIVIVAIVGAYVFYVRVLARKMGKNTVGKKVETGTTNEGIDESWIPKEHGNLRKRTAAK